MKNKIQIIAVCFFIFAGMAATNTAKAQTTDSNTIQEVKLYKNDGFNEVREILMDNFDFTASDYKQGTVNSVVKFEVAENGKIVNVHSQGDCKNVSREIENALKGSYYNGSRKKSAASADMMAYTYVMPVTLEIDHP